MERYQQARVYKITSEQTDQVYIGSTCNALSKRMAAHRGAYRQHLAGNAKKSTAFELVQHPDAVIVLVELCPCGSKEELFQRERFHIENTANCVNRNIPGRTEAERIELQKAYYVANKRHITERVKNYTEANKAAIEARMNELVVCECGDRSTKRNISRHRASKKHANRLAGQG